MIKYYLKHHYYHRLRILGYNNHHEKVRKHVTLPSTVINITNAILLLATIILKHLDSINFWGIHLKAIHIIEIIISISSIILLIIIFFHIYHEFKFRKNRNPPDVFCVDDPSRRLTTDGLNQVAIRLDNSNYLIEFNF